MTESHGKELGQKTGIERTEKDESYFTEGRKKAWQIGIEATAQNLNDLKLHKNKEDKIAREQLEAAKDLAARIEDKAVVIKMKAGEGGRVFGSVSSKEIAQEYKNQNQIDLDKKKIQLQDSIKSFGTYEVPVKLHPQVTGKLIVKVVEA